MNAAQATEARQWAWALNNWGYDEIEIVERIPSGEVFIRAKNRCGMKRFVTNISEFEELRALEATR